jgi:hypothetical protein
LCVWAHVGRNYRDSSSKVLVNNSSTTLLVHVDDDDDGQYCLWLLTQLSSMMLTRDGNEHQVQCAVILLTNELGGRLSACKDLVVAWPRTREPTHGRKCPDQTCPLWDSAIQNLR